VWQACQDPKCFLLGCRADNESDLHRPRDSVIQAAVLIVHLSSPLPASTIPHTPLVSTDAALLRWFADIKNMSASYGRARLESPDILSQFGLFFQSSSFPISTQRDVESGEPRQKRRRTTGAAEQQYITPDNKDSNVAVLARVEIDLVGWFLSCAD